MVLLGYPLTFFNFSRKLLLFGSIVENSVARGIPSIDRRLISKKGAASNVLNDKTFTQNKGKYNTNNKQKITKKGVEITP